MNIDSILNLNNELKTIKSELDKRTGILINEIFREMIDKMSTRLGVDKIFLPNPKKVHHDEYWDDGNSAEIHTGAIAIPTAIQYLIDGRTNYADWWLKALRAKGYASENESFREALRNPEALAFCAGLDNFETLYLDPEKNLAESAELFPDFVKAYHDGRIITSNELSKIIGFKPGFRRLFEKNAASYLLIGALSDNDSLIIYKQECSSTPFFNPDSCWDANFETTGSTTEIADTLLDIIIDPNLQENTSPRM